MATTRDWAEAYLQQARADMRAANCLQGSEASVLAMLLQMVLEKLGKAALLRSGQATVEFATSSHATATRMVQQLANSRRVCARLGWRAAVVRQHVAPVVERLERAQPQLAGRGPCLEYPWETPAGGICWPARDLDVPREFGPKRNSGLLVFRFTTDVCARFDHVIP